MCILSGNKHFLLYNKSKILFNYFYNCVGIVYYLINYSDT